MVYVFAINVLNLIFIEFLSKAIVPLHLQNQKGWFPNVFHINFHSLYFFWLVNSMNSQSLI